MPDVRVLSCGGTIASEPSETGAAPAKRGAELVEAVPELDEYATVTAEEIASYPGFDMQFDAIAAVAEAVEASEADGFVVTHGTDTLADTAYALSILLDADVPVVVTGSQRRFDEVGTDAPANLLTAVRAAASPRFSGVFVAFDDELHAARDVEKTHTNALSTFKSPGKGPVATFTRSETYVHRTAESTASGAASLPAAAASDISTTVPVVHSGIGVSGDELSRAVDAGADGVVVEGTGLGNVSCSLGDAVARAVESVPVVVSSRCHVGPTDQVYGTRGGGVTLREHGALFSGDLPTSKARILLLLALSAGIEGDELAALFD
ncbi:asparaginase [Haloprofundus salinisoli]|uniref:asparaginase n=1 Tax=Haloprofundus salinisoli TaxID=2876193 RepID=UPI001CCA5C02|nr:asparaginase [Haloprofundus salinisoli]